MSMSDPIADMLTRIRNGFRSSKKSVSIPASKSKIAIAKVLLDEGYIGGYHFEGEGAKRNLKIQLKYYRGESVIEEIKRLSLPSCRVYVSCDQIPLIKNGLGVALISTSQGLMTDKQARQAGVGGEVVCSVF
ncbi:MAG: 30S ribosomal protein S8 [Gammaproteobacteria bacterium]|nr:30S ribosomal protein S8 [Gammaproteobacteria bacterium]MCY4217942.1 30S ribosomal protein S8 [Gammaproteobacteria bacterium]MCY4274218.1 30S ribosomal protein S8 [Gammaproteobacteria bacterium]